MALEGLGAAAKGNKISAMRLKLSTDLGFVTPGEIFQQLNTRVIKSDYLQINAPSRVERTWKRKIKRPRKTSFLVLILSMIAPVILNADLHVMLETASSPSTNTPQLRAHIWSNRARAEGWVGGGTIMCLESEQQHDNLVIWLKQNKWKCRKQDSFIAYRIQL